jgi:serine kinase of HPr protein (carbohydrate metabolism regulator)
VTLCHASAVVWERAAVLLTGPSGAGKSDLALRMIDRGWQLLADDQVRLGAQDGLLFAHAPATTRGLIEVRGLGILSFHSVASARVALHVTLAPEPERIPEPATYMLLGVMIPALVLDPRPASAPIKLAHAFARARLALRPHTI